MIIYPAIDIMDGKVVRLIQGDFSQQTVFSDDPAKMLASFKEQGATNLHLVDLSGAKNPSSRQKTLINLLVRQSGLKIQLGGGIRALQEIRELLDLGVDRVVMGSMVVTVPEMAQAALREFGPDRITFALDVKIENGVPMVMTHGWAESSGKSFADVIAPFQGLKRVLCTDIAVDGKMVGPNVALYRELVQQFPTLEIQASGGVEKLADFPALAATGAHSVVVGRALLSGAFSLREIYAQ